MPSSPVPAFQRDIVGRLQSSFPTETVIAEWEAFPRTDVNYAPRLDVAIGPFAHGEVVLASAYTALAVGHAGFLQRLYASNVANLSRRPPDESAIPLDRALGRNPNARCFLAIEIENNVSRKHLMGGAINACALGRLGIVIGWTDSQVLALIQLRSYLLRLARVGKNTFDPANMLILRREQFIEAL